MLIVPGWEMETCNGKQQDLFQKGHLFDDNQCNSFSCWPSGDKLIPAIF